MAAVAGVAVAAAVAAARDVCVCGAARARSPFFSSYPSDVLGRSGFSLSLCAQRGGRTGGVKCGARSLSLFFFGRTRACALETAATLCYRWRPQILALARAPRDWRGARVRARTRRTVEVDRKGASRWGAPVRNRQRERTGDPAPRQGTEGKKGGGGGGGKAKLGASRRPWTEEKKGKCKKRERGKSGRASTLECARRRRKGEEGKGGRYIGWKKKRGEDRGGGGWPARFVLPAARFRPLARRPATTRPPRPRRPAHKKKDHRAER